MTEHGEHGGTSVTEWSYEEFCRNFDHLTPEWNENFNEVLAHMRSHCPVLHSDNYGGFTNFTRYRDIFEAFQNWETFSSAFGNRIPDSPNRRLSRPSEIDPPLQRSYRKLINPKFAPRVVAEFEGGFVETADDLIADFIDAGRCDAVAAYALPFPTVCFFKYLLHAPVEELPTLKSYTRAATTCRTLEEMTWGYEQIANWLTTTFERRRNEPRLDDIIDAVLYGEVEGEEMTDEHRLSVMQLVILGGLDTTTTALGAGIRALAEFPQLQLDLRDDPGLIPGAVEEFVRLGSPANVGRTLTRDVEIDGRVIAAGEKIQFWIASANRDEEEFPNPDIPDPRRRTNRHLGFGAGPHRCVGSHLARLALRVAFERLLEQAADIRLDPDGRVEYRTSQVRSIHSLPITFSASGR